MMRLLPVVALVAGIDALALDKSESSIEARATWTSLGCYSDNVSGRALPNGEPVPGGTNSMTNEACQTACGNAGYSYAGTEYAGECCRLTNSRHHRLYADKMFILT
jgi:hypothetical protein